VRDPSLGIRRVSRRLALSHVLVVVVPLGLTATLWLATTVLGVGADRAAIATRAIESEADAMRTGLRAALESPEGERVAFARWRAEHAERWPRASAWTFEGTAGTRVAGDSVGGEAWLPMWVDSLDRLPDHGLVMLGDSIYVGATARAAGTSRVALALVPVSTFLPRVPGRLADAPLEVLRGTVRAAPYNVTFSMSDHDTVARSTDSTAKDNGITLSAGNHQFRVGDKTRSLRSVLLSGYAIVPGLAWRDTAWTKTGYLLAAAVPPASALSGLSRWAHDNPIGLLPIVLLLTLMTVSALVLVFDLAMVTRMGHGIAAAIGALRTGTARLEAGDLGHRIEIQGDDDLWEVAAAFNTAAAGLERPRRRAGAQPPRERARRRAADPGAAAARGAARCAGPRLAGLSESAREVGGDYYDHLDLGDGRALLVIADVSGKGVPAALLMSGFRASLLSQDLPRIEITELVRRLNESVVRSVRPGRFVTAFVAFVDGTSGRVEYVNAGHNPPVLVRRGGAGPETLTEGGPLLGPFSGARFERGETALAAGDLLALYTDGVTEGADASGAMWGDERLVAALVARASDRCTTIVRTIASEVRAFEGAPRDRRTTSRSSPHGGSRSADRGGTPRWQLVRVSAMFRRPFRLGRPGEERRPCGERISTLVPASSLRRFQPVVGLPPSRITSRSTR
jgi:HAMP domain-containing protein